MPPVPLIEMAVVETELLLIKDGFRNTTTTVISSWKCLLIPRSIFLRSEYRISLFLAATRSAALTSLLAIPYATHKQIISLFKFCFTLQTKS